MKYFLCLFVCYSYPLWGYQGEAEVESIFSQISDIYNPQLEDYQLLERFLEHGRRPYLDPLKGNLDIPERRNCRKLKLIGYNNELPFHKVYHFNTSPDDKERCIIIYNSFNDAYGERAKGLLEDLQKCGYKGHVIFRIGGYPNLSGGGLRLCHIPYAWKIASFLEARSLGYKNVLWMDSSLMPLNNLEFVFQTIQEKGSLFLYAGANLDANYFIRQILPNAIRALNVELFQLPYIPHLSGTVIGINNSMPEAEVFFDEWLKETMEVESSITSFPEEVIYSVAAWRTGLRPLCVVIDYIYYRKPEKNLKPFYKGRW